MHGPMIKKKKRTLVLCITGIIPNKLHGSLIVRNILPAVRVLLEKTITLTICLIIFVFARCMLIVLIPLFAQLMHTNYYKIIKQLKSFKIIILAPTCFGLHKPSSGSGRIRPDPARKLSANLYYIYHCCVYSEKLLITDRGTVRNM